MASAGFHRRQCHSAAEGSQRHETRSRYWLAHTLWCPGVLYAGCVRVCVCSIFGRFACVRAHTNLHGVYIWGMHLYDFRRDLRCWRRASCKARTWQIFCSKMRLTSPLPLFATGLSDTGYACLCVFHPFAPLRHVNAWSAAISSTHTHLNIGTGHVLA